LGRGQAGGTGDAGSVGGVGGALPRAGSDTGEDAEGDGDGDSDRSGASCGYDSRDEISALSGVSGNE
jgi:hypothetical protein